MVQITYSKLIRLWLSVRDKGASMIIWLWDGVSRRFVELNGT